MRLGALTSLQSRLSEYVHHLPPFGSKLGLVNGVTAADIVVSHRIINKFEVPTPGNAAARRQKSIESMLARDSETKHVEWSNDDLRMARARLAVWFTGFKRSYRFVPPSGASARPNGREENIFVKLMEQKNWEVSPELFDYAFNIVWRNHALKRLVRARFRERFPHLTMNEEFRTKHGYNGYAIFREQFRCLVSFNAVARVETVPKDNSEDRVITCEPLWSMICQLSWMRDVREHIRRKLGYDINSRADLHKTLLPHAVATIDLSKASDFVTWELIRNLWPVGMTAQLSALRPSVVSYEVDGEIHYHPLTMYAPMGNGTTFDVMTLTLLALLRFDKSASVFGDDIIVKQEHVIRARLALNAAGLVVNQGKSFIEGSFRESCGGMYHDDIGYIVSYDIKYPETICDVIAICNKLGLILQAGQISFEMAGILEEARNTLLGTLPRVVYADRPLELTADFVTGVSAPQKLHKDNAVLREMLQRDVAVHTAYHVRNKPSGVQLDDHMATLAHLFTLLPVRLERNEQMVTSSVVDTWSCSTLTKELDGFRSAS